jgi:hypothetical protein
MKKQNLYLCIYKKNNKLYFATTRKLTDRIAITNPEFKTVVLSYKNKLQSWTLNGLSDLQRIYPELKEKYAGKIYVIENRYKDMTQIKVVVFLLNNPLWEVGIHEKKEENEVEEGECSTRIIEINDIDDWRLAQREFDFQSNFIYDILYQGEPETKVFLRGEA